MRIKSKDIAKALGISTATVSLAINGKQGVNKETRDKILQYMEELQYKNLGIDAIPVRQKKETIAVLYYYKHGIIMNRSKEIATGINRNMVNSAAQAGYKLIESTYNDKIDNLEIIMDKWKREQIQGLYILGAEMNRSDIIPFINLNIPIVVGDNNFIEYGFDGYLIDNQEGIARAVDYLVDKGHSHIVYLAENIDIFNFLERREAFIKEMEKRDCGKVNNWIWYLGNTIDEVYQSLLTYLDNEIRLPTAFILESSIISLGATKAIIKKGLRIPRDISLIGFDALPPDSVLGFELTLIKGTHSKRHIAAIKHLIRHIEEEELEIIRIYYKTRLIEGNSVFDKAKYNYIKSRGI
jgi:Transcriptional regulators